VVMVTLSWQITLLALVLLPVFLVPAKRMGNRLARLEREAAGHNAAMSTQMTERFSAPGATLVKLFGRPADESAEFAQRARRVRDIGVRTAMNQTVFITALMLVSSLALAVVYGVGGVAALRGTLDAGAVVALALLLTRLYPTPAPSRPVRCPSSSTRYGSATPPPTRCPWPPSKRSRPWTPEAGSRSCTTCRSPRSRAR
jgi:ATP-binding cassette, subfamily B, bacterial